MLYLGCAKLSFTGHRAELHAAHSVQFSAYFPKSECGQRPLGILTLYVVA